MIRMLINSNYLFKRLTRIDFDEEIVRYAELNDGIVNLITDKQKIEVQGTVTGFTNNSIRQEDRNWKDVRDVVASAPEQPIVIEIRESTINLIFQL